MDVLKQNKRLISIILYAVALFATLIFSVYSAFGYGISGFTIFSEAFFSGLLLILAPAAGLVVILVVSKSLDEPLLTYLHIGIGVVGIIMLFIVKGALGGDFASLLSLGFGGVLALICYLLSAGFQAYLMFAPSIGGSAPKARSAIKCPNCGKPVDAGKSFCPNCGQKLN